MQIDTITLHLTRAASSEVHRPGINLGAVDLTATVTLDDGRPELTGALRTSQGSVEITPGDLSAILPELAPIPLDVTLGWSSSRGVDLAGSPTLTARLTAGELAAAGWTGTPEDYLSAQQGQLAPIGAHLAGLGSARSSPRGRRSRR